MAISLCLLLVYVYSQNSIFYIFSHSIVEELKANKALAVIKEEIEKTKSEIKAAEHEDEKSQLEELASVLSGTDTRTDDLTYETEDSDQLIANEACGILDCFNCFLANDNDEKEKERGPSDEETSFPLI